MTHHLFSLLLLPLLALLAATALHAQTAAPAPATGDEKEVVRLDAVEVTAEQKTGTPAVSSTRLPLTVRETPQSISTVSRTTLEEQNLFSIDDVLRNVTGVHAAFYDTERPLYFARGFQITDFQVDGIPTYSGSTNQEYDTALYENITVIRGANGLVTGAGMPSATVDLHRKRPQKNFGASVSGTVGSWDLYRSEADVNLPLSKDGRFRSRFVAVGETTDSFLDRYSDETTAWLASFEGDLTATTTVGAGYQRQTNDPESPTWGVIPRFAADGSLAHLPRSTNFSTDWTKWERNTGTAFVNLDQKLGENWNFRGAYNRTEGDYERLAVYSTGNPDTATGSGLYLRAGANKTEDVRDNIDLYLSGKFTAFDREHDLVFGWNSDRLESNAAVLSGTTGWSYVIPDYRTYNGNAPAPVIVDTGADRVTYTRQSGFYGTARLRPLDPLAFILGARVSTWETYTDSFNASGAYTGRSGVADVSSEITPYTGFVYDITKTLAAYASYTETFKPQTQKDKNNDILTPAIGSNAELGIKAQLLEKRLDLTAAVFETKQDNFAIVDASQPANSLPDGSTPYIAVDGTVSRGAEVDLNASITDDWTASLGYSNVNTRRNAADLTYANVPEHLVRFSTRYRLPGDWRRLSIGAGVNWQGVQTGSVTTHPTTNPVRVTQDSFALLNLFATYRFTDHLTATLSVRNVTDKTYWATLDYPNYGEPRSAQLTVRWTY
ncbi:MAG TPA: TonB-dependent siderophore receptor [Rariglobus sp.]